MNNMFGTETRGSGTAPSTAPSVPSPSLSSLNLTLPSFLARVPGGGRVEPPAPSAATRLSSIPEVVTVRAMFDAPAIAAIPGLSAGERSRAQNIIDHIPDTDFNKTDPAGVRVVAHLLRVLNHRVPDAAKLEKIEFAISMIERLYSPGASTQGEHGTCGAESISRLLNLKDLGEWSRIAADLITSYPFGGGGPVSRTTACTGHRLEAPFDVVQPDVPLHRSEFDKLMQGTLMNAAGPIGYCYSNQSQSYVAPVGTNRASHTSGDGMSLEAARLLVGRIIPRVVGRVLQANPHIELERKTLLAGNLLPDLMTHVQSASGGPSYAVLKWPTASELHAVVLIGQDSAGNILFSNPHGQIRGDAPDPRNPRELGAVLPNGSILEEPPRRIADNYQGKQSMTPEEFTRYFHSALVPKFEMASNASSTISSLVDLVKSFEVTLASSWTREVEVVVPKETSEFLKSEAWATQLAQAVFEAVHPLTPTLAPLNALLKDPPIAAQVARELSDLFADADSAKRQLKIQKVASKIADSLEGDRLVDELLRNREHIVTNDLLNKPELRRALNVARSNYPAAQHVRFNDFIREQVTVGLSEGLRREIISTAEKIISHQANQRNSDRRIADTRALFDVDTTRDGWSHRLDVARIMEFAKQSAASAQQRNKQVPRELGARVHTKELNFGRMYLAATSAVSVLSVWGLPQVIQTVFPQTIAWGGSLSTICAMGSLGLGVIASIKKNNGQPPRHRSGYSWSQFRESFEEAKVPCDAEILAALAATFHAVRGSDPKLSRQPGRAVYLTKLLEAMKEITADGVAGSTSTDQDKKRGDLLSRLDEASATFEQAGFWLKADKAAIGFVTYGNFGHLLVRALLSL